MASEGLFVRREGSFLIRGNIMASEGLFVRSYDPHSGGLFVRGSGGSGAQSSPSLED